MSDSGVMLHCRPGVEIAIVPLFQHSASRRITIKSQGVRPYFPAFTFSGICLEPPERCTDQDLLIPIRPGDKLFKVDVDFFSDSAGAWLCAHFYFWNSNQYEPQSLVLMKLCRAQLGHSQQASAAPAEQ